jgi:hypothetical protein
MREGTQLGVDAYGVRGYVSHKRLVLTSRDGESASQS